MVRHTLVLILAATLPACCGSAQQESKTEGSVSIEVRIDDKKVDTSRPIPLEAGASVQLQVLLRSPDGTTRDVTHDPKTTYATTNWFGLEVSDNGVVKSGSTLGSMLGEEYSILTRVPSAVVVMYGDPGAEPKAMQTVTFEPGKEADPELSLKASKTTLRVGETVQLAAQERQANGTWVDVTKDSGTVYYTTSESKLVPEPDGRVTCIGTGGKAKESAIIGVKRGDKADSVRFTLLAEGPGPTLLVTADRVQLREGESVQLHVSRRSPAGGEEDISAASTGTLYFPYPGYGYLDSSVISISDSGLARATDSIGNMRRRSVMILVRNGGLVGWVELQILGKRYFQGR